MAQADEQFDCLVREFWMGKAFTEAKDLMHSIAQKCGMGDTELVTVASFIETAEVGDQWYFAQVYGQAKADRYKEIGLEAMKAIRLIDAQVISSRPLE